MFKDRSEKGGGCICPLGCEALALNNHAIDRLAKANDGLRADIQSQACSQCKYRR